MSQPSIHAILIHTGSELLQGLWVNQHLKYIGAALHQMGIRVTQAITVGDDIKTIAQAFDQAWSQAQLVIVTGGLGPTPDDVTQAALAKALDLPFMEDAHLVQHLTQRLEQAGQIVQPISLKQCQYPQGFEPILNSWGTAPSLYYTQNHKHLFVLPGPRQELEPMMQEFVLPKIKALGLERLNHFTTTFRTAAIPESDLAAVLDPLFARYPQVDVAYCAHTDLIDVRLSIEHAPSPDILTQLLMDCESLLGEDFLGVGQPDLAAILLHQLAARGQTISVAESCTGGLLADRITQIPGASKVFAGGLVCYQDDAKMELLGVPEALIEQHTAVSPEVAVAMAVGCAETFGTDFALSTTGFAGPNAQGDMPPGTIFLGYATPDGVWSRKLFFPEGRAMVKLKTVHAALDWARRELLAEQDVSP